MKKTIKIGIGYSAGYENKMDGNTYKHEVFRVFFKVGTYYPVNFVKTEEIPIENLLAVCPVDAEQIFKIFDKGLSIINVHTDVEKSVDVDYEYWECGKYGEYVWERISDKPALDNGWCESLKIRNDKFYKEYVWK